MKFDLHFWLCSWQEVGITSCWDKMLHKIVKKNFFLQKGQEADKIVTEILGQNQKTKDRGALKLL